MRDKVARNSMKTPVLTSTTVSSVPRNILQPRSASSTLPTLLTQTAVPYHHVSPSSLPTTPIIKPDAFTTTVSVGPLSTTSNVFDQIMPLLPTILDEDDLLDSVSTPSFTILQSCPLDLTLNPRPEKRKRSASPKQSRRRLRSPMTAGMLSLLKISLTHMLTLDTPGSSSSPIIAVRRVMNTLLSTRTRELEQICSQTKAPRGKRLTSKIGLNITEDEFVQLAIKESEEKKQKAGKTRVLKYPNITSTSTTTTTTAKKPRGRPRKKNVLKNHNIHANDDEIEAGIRSLQSTIDTTNKILNGEDSAELSD